MQLPQDFIKRMENLLEEEAAAFFSSYEKEKTYGLRLNPLKNGGFLSSAHAPFTLSPIPWSEDGFFSEPSEHPGRHPLHEAGAYYIQEPSAMCAASLLAPMPGDIICDFCAAPGGKSTAIGAAMQGEGLLVSNEIIPARAKILSQNIERFGIPNCIVTNEPPEKMSKAFPGFFDKILVDAPCSGEGMFRKNPQACAEWSPAQVELCRKRQQLILEEAHKMLRPGGILVYSTCTFSPEENEYQIAAFLDSHPDYVLEDWRDFLPQNCALAGGRAWRGFPDMPEAGKTLRLWPHLIRGEGHFAARLHKTGEPSPAKKKKSKKSPPGKDFLNFCQQYLITDSAVGRAAKLLHSDNKFRFFGEELYLVPSAMKALAGIKILRAGLHLGSLKKNRFEPSHALAMAILPEETKQTHPCDDDSVLSYLRGEPIPCQISLHSWTLVTYQGYSLGWGKATGGVLKNHYPKGLRIH